MSKETSIMDTLKPFIFGGVSGCVATTCIQPLDTIKVRIQIASEKKGLGGANANISTSPFAVAGEMYKSGGLTGFYKGIDAALTRQIVYGTIRLGLYRVISNKIEAEKKRHLSLGEKAAASLFSGLIGAIAGNPADLALVRVQADSQSPPELRRNYKHIGDALTRMVKEEGILTLWRGSTPTVLRAMLMNLGMMTTFDQIKEFITHNYTHDPKSQLTSCIASACAGVVCSFLSLPADNIKTRIYNMRPDKEGKLPYKGVVDCAMKTISREGVTGLWVGFITYCTRVSPHAIIALITMDWLNNNFGKKNF